MRRMVGVVGVVALSASLLATLAFAASVRDFSGAVNKGGRIKFSAVRDGERYTRAGLFAFRRIPVNCRGGKNAKKKAVVAVARKLAVLMHRLWSTGEVYEPLRTASKMLPAA